MSASSVQTYFLHYCLFPLNRYIIAPFPLVISLPKNTFLTVSNIIYPDGFSGDWSGGTIPVGCSQSVTVSFTPTVRQAYDGFILVESDASSGEAYQSISGSTPEPGEVYWLVTFDSGDHGVISSSWDSVYVQQGFSAIAPSATPDPFWTFTGWDSSANNVQQNLTLTAQYRFTLPATIFKEPFNAFTETPGFVTASFRLTDLSGQGVNIPFNMVEHPDFFTVKEDGETLSPSESSLQVDKMYEIENSKLQMVLML